MAKEKRETVETLIIIVMIIILGSRRFFAKLNLASKVDGVGGTRQLIGNVAGDCVSQPAKTPQTI